MKNVEYYALATATEGLDKYLTELEEELDNLDPAATNVLRHVIVPKLRGLHAFMEGEVNE